MAHQITILNDRFRRRLSAFWSHRGSCLTTLQLTGNFGGALPRNVDVLAAEQALARDTTRGRKWSELPGLDVPGHRDQLVRGSSGWYLASNYGTLVGSGYALLSLLVSHWVLGLRLCPLVAGAPPRWY